MPGKLLQCRGQAQYWGYGHLPVSHSGHLFVPRPSQRRVDPLSCSQHSPPIVEATWVCLSRRESTATLPCRGPPAGGCTRARGLHIVGKTDKILCRTWQLNRINDAEVALTFLFSRNQIFQKIDRNGLIAREIRLAIYWQEVKAFLLRVVLSAEFLCCNGNLLRCTCIY